MTVWLPIVLPAGIAAACLFVSWRAWRRRNLNPNGHWGGALGIAAAFFAAHVVLLGRPSFPPGQSAEWLAWMAVPLAAAGIAQRWWGGRWFAAWPVRLLLSIGFCILLLRARIENDWYGSAVYLWIGCLAVALAAQWFSLESLAAIRPGASFPLSLAVLCVVSAGTFTLAGSASIGQISAALAAACGSAVILAWWAAGLSLRGGAMTAFVPLYYGLVLRSYFFGELTPWSAGLLLAAPFALWYGELRRFRFARPWKSALVRAALIAAPALVALGIEWWSKARSEEMY